MPHLYCEQHGKEHEARVQGQVAVYRQERERVLIVKGKLRSGSWLCDRCNARLSEGMMAYFLEVFPRWITEQMPDSVDDYYARRYFAIEEAEVRLYGAEGTGEA
jgi:hypothetical protein